jgi:hypothetical protein
VEAVQLWVERDDPDELGEAALPVAGEVAAVGLSISEEDSMPAIALSPLEGAGLGGESPQEAECCEGFLLGGVDHWGFSLMASSETEMAAYLGAGGSSSFFP